jgi:hypothetical protein
VQLTCKTLILFTIFLLIVFYKPVAAAKLKADPWWEKMIHDDAK